jgi:hypothetical protein
VNEASVKAILAVLVAEVEDLRASQAVAIATLCKQLNQSSSQVQGLVDKAKFSNKGTYDKLRKAIDEISS